MKTKNLFRMFVVASLCATVSFGAKAQLTTAHTTSVDKSIANEGTDYVTKGATVPYQISSSLPIWDLISQGVLVSSVYNWSIGAGPTMHQSDGSSALVAVANKGTEVGLPAGFYNDTAITISYPATGSFTLSVAERSVSNVAGVSGCLDAVGATLPVQVTNRPAVIFNSVASIGGCGTDVAPNNNIPITISGSNSPIVTYKIDYTNLGGTTTPLVPSTPVNDAVLNSGWTAFSVDNPVTNVVIPFNIINGNYGKYVVTLQAITDRISRKTLDIAVGGAQDPGDVVLSGPTTLTIYAYPTPSTQPIKHVTNLAW
jgi:hypothetical protein